MQGIIQRTTKRNLLVVFFMLTSIYGWSADTLKVCSPSGKICVKIWMDKQLSYSISYKNKTILNPSSIDLILDNTHALSIKNTIRGTTLNKISEQIISPVPEKRKIIPDIYSHLSISFKQPYKVDFKVYDDGVAYQISTKFKDCLYIKNEVAEFNFPGKPSAYFPQVQKRADADIFHTSFEEEYPLRRIDSIPEGVIGYSPILVVPASNPKIAITESDLVDYPGMFLGGTGSSTLKGVFAGYPLESRQWWDYTHSIKYRSAPLILPGLQEQEASLGGYC